jgi:hypothetical protein
MAQNRMMPPALLEQLQGADTDVLRRVLEHAMQRLIEAEAATQIGAGPHERSASRTTYRNGYRERILDTGSGRSSCRSPSYARAAGGHDDSRSYLLAYQCVTGPSRAFGNPIRAPSSPFQLGY